VIRVGLPAPERVCACFFGGRIVGASCSTLADVDCLVRNPPGTRTATAEQRERATGPGLPTARRGRSRRTPRPQKGKPPSSTLSRFVPQRPSSRRDHSRLPGRLRDRASKERLRTTRRSGWSGQNLACVPFFGDTGVRTVASRLKYQVQEAFLGYDAPSSSNTRTGGANSPPPGSKVYACEAAAVRGNWFGRRVLPAQDPLNSRLEKVTSKAPELIGGRLFRGKRHDARPLFDRPRRTAKP